MNVVYKNNNMFYMLTFLFSQMPNAALFPYYVTAESELWPFSYFPSCLPDQLIQLIHWSMITLEVEANVCISRVGYFQYPDLLICLCWISLKMSFACQQSWLGNPRQSALQGQQWACVVASSLTGAGFTEWAGEAWESLPASTPVFTSCVIKSNPKS